MKKIIALLAVVALPILAQGKYTWSIGLNADGSISDCIPATIQPALLIRYGCTTNVLNEHYWVVNCLASDGIIISFAKSRFTCEVLKKKLNEK